MSDVLTAMRQLTAYADELNHLSTSLAEVERQLEPVHAEVTKFTDDFELGLYTRSIEEDGYKLPSEALRVKLARRALPPELYGRHVALVASRDRLQQRIKDLRILIESQRSLLSAEKTLVEGSQGSQPQWSRAA